MTTEELNEILSIDENYRIERTVSTGNMDKFQEAKNAEKMLTVNVVYDDVYQNKTQLTDRQKDILQMMLRDSAISATSMSHILSVSKRTIQRDLQVLTNLGMIKHEGDKLGGKWIIL